MRREPIITPTRRILRSREATINEQRTTTREFLPLSIPQPVAQLQSFSFQMNKARQHFLAGREKIVSPLLSTYHLPHLAGVPTPGHPTPSPSFSKFHFLFLATYCANVHIPQMTVPDAAAIREL
jgi:hypothetical protein